MTIDPVNRDASNDPVLREGDDVLVRFKIADTTSGAPLKNIYPAAWVIDREAETTAAKDCTAKIQTLVSGSLLTPPELDLNVYHILTLNEDATMTVIDPRFGFGGSKMLALVALAATGQDWALSADESRVFVSMPEVGQVAVVDTSTWKVLENLEVGPLPTRVALQPDGQYLWVAHDRASWADAKLTAIDVSRGRVAGEAQIGRGPHEFAFSADSRYAFVTNAEGGSVSVVDTRSLKAVEEVTVGALPTSLSYSSMADMIYVTSADPGSIIVIDANTHRIVNRVDGDPGIARIGFAPGGRLGFVLVPKSGRLAILDASSNRLIQKGTLREGPDQVAFSNDFAYIRHRGTENVIMVPLAKVGEEGRPIPTIDFPAGQNPLGKTSRPSPAHAIVKVPGENGVLIANPSDKSVYFYKEGMASPMGSFTNYSREPRAVLVVDRSLRDPRSSGEYETMASLRRPGRFDVALFLATPRIVRCIPIEVAPDPALASERDRRKTSVESLNPDSVVAAGEPMTLSFRLTRRLDGSPRTGLKDLVFLVYSPEGWQLRSLGKDEGDGVYSAEFVPPQPGAFYATIGCDSIGLLKNAIQPLRLQAVTADSGAPADLPGGSDPDGSDVSGKGRYGG
jgi:YVTN family beta-propeller protein